MKIIYFDKYNFKKYLLKKKIENDLYTFFNSLNIDDKQKKISECSEILIDNFWMNSKKHSKKKNKSLKFGNGN